MWIRLKNIQVYAYHGVHDYEREHGTRFEIDVELDAALDTAVKSDGLADTIDYVSVQEEVTAITISNRFHLVETLADRIASELLAKFPAREVIVRVRKPGAALGVILDTVEIECRKTKS
jgi:7,8-dihydroneopterin aldolase/epimerase/oxygenase